MKLTVFNGSPRGKTGNTTILMDKFLNGFMETAGNEYEIVYLNQVNKQNEFLEKFKGSDTVILAFPLYTDAMPGIVKEFIETLVAVKGRKGNPSIGFVTQSGFREGIHTEGLARYMEKLATRLGCKLTGIARRGGIEGIQIQPPIMTNKIFKGFHDLGAGFGATGMFDPELVTALNTRRQHNALGRMIIRLMHRLKLADLYWDQMMKKNKVYEKRFDRPYTQ